MSYARLYKPLLLSCLLLISLAACGKKEAPPAGSESPTIKTLEPTLPPRDMKIGVLGPETGELAEYGKKTLAAAELAVAEINARGGVLGKKLELLHMDNKNDSETTNNIMSEMIRQKVVAVVANPTGWSTFGPISLANEYHTILFSAGTRRKMGHSGDYVFRNTVPDEIAAAEIIKYAATKLSYKDYALITVMDDDYSVTLSGLFKKGVFDTGGQIVAETYLMSGAAESAAQYADVVAEIKKKGTVQAIIYTGGAGAGKLLKEARKQGIKAPIIGGEELHSASFLQEAGDTAVDSILYTGYVSSAETAKFNEAYRAKTKSEPDAMAALAYDAVMMIAKAIEKADSTAPNKVRDALAGLKECVGITGVCSFDGGGEPLKKPFLLKVSRQGNGLAFVPAP